MTVPRTDGQDGLGGGLAQPSGTGFPRRLRRVLWAVSAGAALVTGVVLAVVHLAAGNGPAGPAGAHPTPAAPPVHAIVYLCTKGECPDGAATAVDRQAVRAALDTTPGVADVAFVDQKEAYRRFRTLFADRPDLLDSVRPDSLPESFRFTVDADRYAALERRLKGLHGVDKVQRQPDAPTPPSTPHT